MRLYPLAAVAALMPVITIHITYVWAASLGHVDWCVPHFHSCTSISRASRQPPENLFFVAFMIPSAVILATYWCLSSHWLKSLGCAATRLTNVVMVMGLIGSAGLVLYSVALGHIGDLYYLQRRIGVVSFFGMTYLGQLLIIYLLRKTMPAAGIKPASVRWLERSALLIMAVALINIVLSAVDYDLYKRTDDAFEWTFVVLLCLHVLLTARLWRESDFRLTFRSTQ